MSINIDYETTIDIDENSISWQKSENCEIYKKIFSKDGDKETALIKMETNESFKNSEKTNSVEVFVLEGVYSNEFGDFEKGTYLKLPQEQENKIKTISACKIFKKTNYEQINKEKVIVDTSKSFWRQGQGNLQVMPLSEQTALVKWPQNERFVPHTHWGGEEILVLSGTFIDEHGKYKMGTWIRSPHLSRHFPYVEEETIIFVKTGHM